MFFFFFDGMRDKKKKVECFISSTGRYTGMIEYAYIKTRQKTITRARGEKKGLV